LSEKSFVFCRERVVKLTKDTAVVAVSGGKHILIEVDRRCCSSRSYKKFLCSYRKERSCP